MKMEIDKKNFESFKGWIKVICTIVEEQTIEAREDGLHVIGMDPSHVAMINTSFLKENFDVYEVGDDDSVTLMVKELFKILDRVKDERVFLEYDVKQAKFLVTTKKGTRLRRFKMDILGDVSGEVPEPKIFFKSKVRMTIDDFDLGLNDAQLVSEHIVLTMDKKNVKIAGLGDMGDTLAQWDSDSDDVLHLTAEEESKATFTLSYMMDIIKAMKSLCEVVTIELSTDMPVRIEAECPSGVTAEFYLAPCIGV